LVAVRDLPIAQAVKRSAPSCTEERSWRLIGVESGDGGPTWESEC